MRALAADFVELPHYSKTGFISLQHYARTDKGMLGGQVGKGRMYLDIQLPPLTPNLLIDVGMSMMQVPGVIGLAPRWFTMFNPIACPQDELFGAAKCKSAIMLTWRIYF